MDWKQLLGHITRPVDEELRRRTAYLAAENRILRNQIKARRVQLTDAERKTLAEIGQKLGRQVLEKIATVAKPDTILGWHRTLVAQTCGSSQPRKALGRSRITQELEANVSDDLSAQRSKLMFTENAYTKTWVMSCACLLFITIRHGMDRRKVDNGSAGR
jgi:ribosomal protein S26